MKKHSATLLLSLFFVSVGASIASAQTADAVVEKCLTALGGREALGKITTRKSTGTATVSTPGGDVSGPIEISLKAPNKSYVITTLDLSAMGAGQMTVTQYIDGVKGTTVNSLQGENEMTGSELQNALNGVMPTPLLHYKEAGMKIELLPNQKIDGKDLIVLLVTPKAGPAVHIFVDPATYLIARTAVTINSAQMGGDVEQTADYSDYRPVDGVQVAFRAVNSGAQQSITLVFTKVQHNVPMDDAMFVKK
jgi:hypothetical protein